MNESEYLSISDKALALIETSLDQIDGDIDYERSGVVLTIEFDDGTQLVINKQAPMQEIWVASKLGAHHFRWQDNHWLDTRTQAELFEFVGGLIKQLSGIEFHIGE